MPTWVVDGDDARLRPGRRRHRPRRRQVSRSWSRTVRGIDWVHPGGVGPGGAARSVMDECGIHAQVLYPNAVGIGGQNARQRRPGPGAAACCASRSTTTPWPSCRRSRATGFLPMPVMPAWDVDAVRAGGRALRRPRATRRQHDLRPAGLRLARPRPTAAWDPLWEVCADLAPAGALPHRREPHGAWTSTATTSGRRQDEYVKPAIGGAMLFLNNARVVINSVYAGIFDRSPDAEDGVGRERHRLDPVHPRDDGLRARARTRPSTRRSCRSCRRSTSGQLVRHVLVRGRTSGDLQGLIDKVGEDNVMFETDFPHPTCLYPTPLETVDEKMSTLAPRDPPQGDGRERPQALPHLNHSLGSRRVGGHQRSHLTTSSRRRRPVGSSGLERSPAVG